MLVAVLTMLLGVVVILAIIVANGFFVAQEFAYMSVDRSRLGAKAEAGDAAAARALAVTRRTSFMLSGAQLGITVTGLLVGYVAEPLVGESLGTLLGGVGIPAAVSVTIGTVLALALSTVVQMIFGELFPKNLAIANPEPLARWLAAPTLFYLGALGWLIYVFDRAAAGLLRLLRIEPVEDVDSSATARDLEHIIADSRESGDLPEELSMMLDRILDFPQQDVEHAMIPRSRVGTVSPDTSIERMRELMAREHTRYPVIDDEDQPVGMVQLVDLLRAEGLRDDQTVADLMREPLIVPTPMSLPDALGELRASGQELACVIDEYGGFTGILTLEDLAEEVAGEITDEHDVDEPPLPVRDAEDQWRMGGDVHIDEAERAIGHRLPRGDYETIAGLLIAERGALPEEGETLRIDLGSEGADMIEHEPVRRVVDAEILEVDRHVPTLVRLALREIYEEDDTADRDEEER
ncbi:hemolysin family protein [Microbacterium sp. LRZ72]|uniref:hemolysin family protein n=1 Tax=Microbacterium sp. LRZ72 TaxID=2942481 RepID=UPI0029BF7482|nr:hemolysin family protein [Microbacterium sp. LRZ72]MDX2377105.1 hemolysin family protein [Microbacterium sp. LRZ72]